VKPPKRDSNGCVDRANDTNIPTTTNTDWVPISRLTSVKELETNDTREVRSRILVKHTKISLGRKSISHTSPDYTLRQTPTPKTLCGLCAASASRLTLR